MGYIPPVSTNTRIVHASKVPLNAKIDAIMKTKNEKISDRSQKSVRKEFPKYFGQYVDRKV